jgi:acetyl-CoA acetyltransferase
MEYGHKYGGTSFELFAKISEKNHAHSTLNPLAAYQKKFTLDEIMNDMMIAYPNTRPMCSANCDGAAAASWSTARRSRRCRSSSSAGRQGQGVGAHHRPVGGGLPGPARTSTR